MRNSSWESFILSAVCVAVVGCAREITAPTVTGMGAFANAGKQARGIPNSTKYRDRGAKPGAGHSGSASLEVRALLGQDGLTTLEVTTGTFDDGTHPGTITKIQVKILVGHGKTTNYNNLDDGGYWTDTLRGLAKGDAIQVQANIRGIDGKRTDVATAVATVSRRPDLAVMSLYGPARAPADVPVTFAASVAELNGDAGARADCLFSVDGVQVGHATGIWVDAGGSVSCVLTYAFRVSGVHTVRVSLAKVDPADWSGANDSASTTIAIGAPGVVIPTGYVTAVRDHRGWTTHSWNDGPYPFDNRDTNAYDESVVYASGTEPNGTVTLPLARVDFTIAIDGIFLYSRSLTAATSQYDNDDGSFTHHCWQAFDGTDLGQACNNESDDPVNTPSYASFDLEHMSGTVTYFAHGFTCDTWGCDTYAINVSNVYGSGLSFGLGNSVRVQAEFVDGAGVGHWLNQATTIAGYDNAYWTPGTDSTCWLDTYRGGTSCSTQTRWGSYLRGYTEWP